MNKKYLALLSLPVLCLIVAAASNYPQQGNPPSNPGGQSSADFGRPPEGYKSSGAVPVPRGTPSSDIGREPGTGNTLRGGQPPRQSRPLPQPGS